MDSLFFYLSKSVWIVLSPGSWLIFLPVIAWLLQRLRLKRLSSVVWSIEIVLVLLIGFYPVGQWLVRPLESYSTNFQTVDDKPDGIIVLGGAWLTDVSRYWQQWELNHAAEREFAFVALARRYPEAKLVFTGGSGKVFSQQTKESNIAKLLYQDLGLDVTRIAFESESRNTYENAVFSKSLVNPEEGEIWWLITSAYHMPRSIGVFCAQSWSVQPYPVDHFYAGFTLRPNWAFVDHLWELDKVSHEWIGLLVYRITGKSEFLFPRLC